MVRHYPDFSGRVAERSKFDPEEIDKMCQTLVTTFLREKYGKSSFPISTDDLTVLIEQHVERLDIYADLSKEGDTVDGLTEFFPNSKPVVYISGSLAEDDKRQNRFRTTLAHELGHVKVHDYIWKLTMDAQKAAGIRGNANRIVCKRDGIEKPAFTDWMEWQANYFSGALLMPRRFVLNRVNEFKQELGLDAIKENSPEASKLAERVMEAFEVSQQAAIVRLSALKHFATEDSHPHLFKVPIR